MLGWVVWLSSSGISYISNVSTIMVSGILDILNSAIGQQNVVRTMNGLAIRFFILSEVNSMVLICYSICVSVWSWLVMSWCGVITGRWSVEPGGGPAGAADTHAAKRITIAKDNIFSV